MRLCFKSEKGFCCDEFRQRMQRDYVADRMDCGRTEQRQKFIEWLQKEEDIDNTEADEEPQNHEQQTRQPSPMHDSEVARILHTDFEKEFGGQRQHLGFDRGDIRSGERSVSPTISICTDWSALLDSLGEPCSPSIVESGESTSILDGEDFVSDTDGDVFDDVDEFEADFENVLQEYGRQLYSHFVNGRQKYISTVIVPDGPSGVVRCLKELETMVRRYPPRNWYVFAAHDDHVHVSHICDNGNNSCRCIWIRNCPTITKYRRPGLRRSTRAVQLEPSDYVNILRYLSSGTRLVQGVGGVAADERLCNRYKYLSVCISSFYYGTAFYFFKRTQFSYTFSFTDQNISKKLTVYARRRIELISQYIV